MPLRLLSVTKRARLKLRILAGIQQSVSVLARMPKKQSARGLQNVDTGTGNIRISVESITL